MVGWWDGGMVVRSVDASGGVRWWAGVCGGVRRLAGEWCGKMKLVELS